MMLENTSVPTFKLAPCRSTDNTAQIKRRGIQTFCILLLVFFFAVVVAVVAVVVVVVASSRRRRRHQLHMQIVLGPTCHRQRILLLLTCHSVWAIDISVLHILPRLLPLSLFRCIIPNSYYLLIRLFIRVIAKLILQTHSSNTICLFRLHCTFKV